MRQQRYSGLAGACAIVLSTLTPTIAQAQAALPGDATVAPITQPPTSACELHVWPAQSMGAAQNNYMSGGLLNVLVTEAIDAKERAKIKEAHVASVSGKTHGPLSTRDQTTALAAARLPDLLGLAGSNVVLHDQPLDSTTVRTVKTRYVASAASCYADLVISSNVYEKDFMTGRNLRTFFRFRDFAAGPAPVRSYGTWVNTALAVFSMEKGQDETDEAGLQELARAFQQNLNTFAVLLRTPKLPKAKS